VIRNSINEMTGIRFLVFVFIILMPFTSWAVDTDKVMKECDRITEGQQVSRGAPGLPGQGDRSNFSDVDMELLNNCLKSRGIMPPARSTTDILIQETSPDIPVEPTR